MNERIKQLLNQAGIYQPDRFDAIDGSNQMEKFAELIVAKMLQTCEDHPGWSGRMIGEQIKQDFGVEE
jgi:hypothetical protein